MLYLVVILLAAIAVKVTKGRLLNIANIKFRKPWLFLIAAFLLIILRIIVSKGVEMPIYISFIIQGIAYVMLLFGFWSNKRIIGFSAIGVGFLLNVFVMMLNEGKMPVDIDILKKANINSSLDLLANHMDIKHCILDYDTKLSFLADVIYIPGFLGWLMPIVSIGDLIIAIGLFLIIFIESKECKLCFENSEVNTN